MARVHCIGIVIDVFIVCLVATQYRGLAPMYYRGSAAAIVVYDITSEVRSKFT